MFMDLQWFWWLAIGVAVLLSIPLKIRFMKQWSKRRQERKGPQGKWGDEE